MKRCLWTPHLIAVVNGLNGFPDAIKPVVPQTQVQTCIVHLLRHALSLPHGRTAGSSCKHSADLHPGEREVAREALDAFADGPWGRKYPAIAPAWRRQWEQVIPFFAYPPQVRRIIYTTDEVDKPPAQRIACFSVDDEIARAKTTQRSLIQTRPVSQSTSMPIY